MCEQQALCTVILYTYMLAICNHTYQLAGSYVLEKERGRKEEGERDTRIGRDIGKGGKERRRKD